MKKQDILELISAGENSSVEFKQDEIRPEQFAKEAVGMANLQGGVILLGVSDDGSVTGISRPNLEAWVMDTVFRRYVHPMIIPHYQEFSLDDNLRIAAITVSAGTSKPYVVRHRDREDMYVRIGSTTRLATREQALRLFASGRRLHAETRPVSGSSMKDLDRARVENYLRDILDDPGMPTGEEQWIERLHDLGFLATDGLGQRVCSIAGLALFGVHPRRHLPQAGLRVMAFAVADKQYQALLDVVLDGPMVGRWATDKGQAKTLIDEGVVEKFVRTIEPFVSVEANQVDRSFRREKTWLFPLEAVRETVLNALVHRDWTRAVDIEITRYSDRLEVVSPGALPNSMTIDKMKAGRRTPRNPIVLEVMRDYGYVDARGMGVRTKIIPLTRQLSGMDPIFEGTDDYLKTSIHVATDPENVPENAEMSLKQGDNTHAAPADVPENTFQGHLLSLIQNSPHITYDELAEQTGHSRKTVQRNIQTLKEKGMLCRVGPAKGGHWKVLEA